MNTELTKNDVSNLLVVWSKWMNGPEPPNNKPEEFLKWDENCPEGFRMIFGSILHTSLWLLVKLGLLSGFPSLSIWASKKSIKYDSLYWEPMSCKLNRTYTDMGVAYLKSGNVEEAIGCLSKSWLVYPCPHNTTFGLSLGLYNKLRNYQEATSATSEYQEMWRRFKAS